ncbi:MAG: type II toxin-antitoxin system Phd/YefM family antitoxin [Acidobacteria bacterium]|nr:type II toxin-antitoxin system Phd/YefM family antitoxin [Acidobacteriota bacterium]
MPISATELRANIYQILDEAIATGKPVEVERKGVVLQVVPPRKKRDLSKMPKRNCVIGDSEDLVHMDWSVYWKPYL